MNINRRIFMFRSLSRKENVLISLFIISLIITTISPSDIYRQFGNSDTKNTTIVNQGKLALPYLPAEKMDTEQILIILQQRCHHFSDIPRLLLFSLCRLNPLLLMVAVLFFMYCRNLLLSCYNPVKSRIIRYIHHKEDHR